jgi:hypothetical protein
MLRGDDEGGKEEIKVKIHGGKQATPSTAVTLNKACVNLPGMTPAERQSFPDLWQAPRSLVSSSPLLFFNSFFPKRILGYLSSLLVPGIFP